MARWLSRLTHDHHFRLEVCFRAVSLLDSFLSIMKVKGWGMISFNREEDFMCITRAMGSGKGLPYLASSPLEMCGFFVAHIWR